MTTAHHVTGVMTDDRTVALDEALPMTSARVRLVVEPILGPLPPYEAVIGAIRARRRSRGREGPDRAEVARRIEAERAGWDESR